jgi:membrane peptidoglycan carboxypeptidase
VGGVSRSKGNKVLIVIVKERKPEKEGLTRRLLRTRVVKILIAVFLVFSIVSSAVVIHYYNRYTRIIDLKLNRQVFQNTAKIYSASAKLVTSLSGSSRAKRRLVEFDDIPKVLVDAVTAGEDQKFFSHHGLDPIRIAGAFVSNRDETHRLQGGSTITQQLARNFFLTAEPTWRRIEPHALRRVVAADGRELKTYKYGPREVLRPEIAYLITHMMEGVIDRGTGAGVRARGFKLPAAGKTGTSRDGWFAGYTKDLLVIAWVGFDDNSDLNLEGARSALPIWTDFMLRAYELYPVRDAARMSFMPPSGIEIVSIDADTFMRATPLCQSTFEEAFIVGTAPTAFCALHSLKITKRF